MFFSTLYLLLINLQYNLPSNDGLHYLLIILIFYFRLYTSIPLANFLLENDMTIVGTVNVIRRGIPLHMKNVTERTRGDYQILYEVGGKISLHSWIVQPKKGIVKFVY